MSVDLKQIISKTEQINQDFSQALEILKELFKNGVKPSKESIKNVIDEVLARFDFVKENELEEKLQALLEELKALINKAQADLNFVSNVRISTEPVTPLTEANINDIVISYNDSGKKMWLCTAKKGSYTGWIDLLSDESMDLKEKIIITFNTRLISGSYGGCLSDLRFAFDGEFASTAELKSGLNEGGFIISKDAQGLTSLNFTEVNELSQISQNQIKGKISTTDIYPDPNYHCITNALKKYNGYANECCLWTNNITHQVSIELETDEIPSHIFHRQVGYYGVVELSDVSVKKMVANAVLARFNGLIKESETYGDNAVLFEIREITEEE